MGRKTARRHKKTNLKPVNTTPRNESLPSIAKSKSALNQALKAIFNFSLQDLSSHMQKEDTPLLLNWEYSDCISSSLLETIKSNLGNLKLSLSIHLFFEEKLEFFAGSLFEVLFKYTDCSPFFTLKALRQTFTIYNKVCEEIQTFAKEVLKFDETLKNMREIFIEFSLEPLICLLSELFENEMSENSGRSLLEDVIEEKEFVVESAEEIDLKEEDLSIDIEVMEFTRKLERYDPESFRLKPMISDDYLSYLKSQISEELNSLKET